MPPPPRKPPPPGAPEKVSAEEPALPATGRSRTAQASDDRTDPGAPAPQHAPIDVMKTGAMKLPPRKPAPPVFGKPKPVLQPKLPPVADTLEPPPPGAGERTLIYDQNKAARLTGDESPRLLITAGPRAGSEVVLSTVETTIGRGGDNTIVIPDLSVSRRHSIVRREAGGAWVVMDQGSGNGTRVNGLVIGKHELQSGDVIDLGDTSMQFVEAGGVAVRGGKRSGNTGEHAIEKPVRQPPHIGGPGSATEERPELTNPRATGLQRRTPLYAAVGLALFAALAAGWLRKRTRERAEAQAAQSTGSRAAAQQQFADAVELVKAGKWVEARDKLAIARSLDDESEEIKRYLDRARSEAPRAQAVTLAQAAIARRDYRSAREQLRSVPEDSALSAQAGELLEKVRTSIDQAVLDARQAAESGDAATAEALLQPVLDAEPQRRDALAVKETISGARRAQVAAVRREKPRAREEQAEKKADDPPQDPGLAAIVTTYLSGDIRSAITRAESAGVTDARAARMARELRELDQGYRDGIARADAKKPTEALRALEAADRADRDIAQGKPSRIGAELRRVLSRVHYQLGAAGVSSDAGLPEAARHLRAAVLADPDNDLAKQQLDQVVARAKEIYLRAYVAKDTDTPAAREMFKLVADILPAGDSTSEKAKHWLEKIDGKPAKDDAPQD